MVCSDNPIKQLTTFGLQQLYLVETSQTLLYFLDLSQTSVVRIYADSCIKLHQINIQNGVNTVYDATFDNLPFHFNGTISLTAICADDGEIEAVQDSGAIVANIILNTAPNCTLATNSLDRIQTTVYPNPATDVIYLKLSGTEMAEFQMYAADSKLLESGILNPGENRLNIDWLSSGINFIELIDQRNSSVLKFVVR